MACASTKKNCPRKYKHRPLGEELEIQTKLESQLQLQPTCATYVDGELTQKQKKKSVLLARNMFSNLAAAHAQEEFATPQNLPINVDVTNGSPKEPDHRLGFSLWIDDQ